MKEPIFNTYVIVIMELHNLYRSFNIVGLLNRQDKDGQGM